MLTEPTLEKLQSLRLSAMADAWQQSQKNTAYAELSFDERFGILVDAEFLARENRTISRRLREAKLRIPSATVEDIQEPLKRGIKKEVLRDLASGAWINQHLNVIITGATGVGKSYLACALGHSACRQGRRVLYRRVSRLFDEIKLSQASGDYIKLLAKLARADILILDDWGIGALNEQQRHHMLEILEDRYGRRSTIVTSQLPVEKWHDHIGDPTIADAVLDRLVHNAHRLKLKGPSKRKESANS